MSIWRRILAYFDLDRREFDGLHPVLESWIWIPGYGEARHRVDYGLLARVLKAKEVAG
jgi:hypothetical protein